MENRSCLLSDILDYIGYDKEIISIRRNIWQQFTRPLINKRNPWVAAEVVGSKAEGLASHFESDIDFMYLSKDAICSDDIKHLTTVSGYTTLYADTRETPPGYTRLKMISCQGEISRHYLNDSFFEPESSDGYISSSIFVCRILNDFGMDISSNLEFLNDFCQKLELSGPALPTIYFRCLSIDCVAAFPCSYPKILQTWKKRRRLYSWPPEDVIEAAASMQPQVVPAGSKISDDQWLEWRFCFIPSELKLTFSLNETQIKLYILLKMVAKDILKNVNKGISSYMMKNITYWMSELLPEELFRKENLIDLLFMALMYLKLSISESNSLPYYMIPERNLLSEKLAPESRGQMCDLIDTLIAEGPHFIFMRCNKPRIALECFIASPTLLIDYGSRRNKLEKDLYSIAKRVIPLMLQNNKDFICAIFGLFIGYFLPDIETLLKNGTPLTDITNLFEERFLLFLEKFIPILS